ncbi:MAG: hypothetical protein V1929_02795 [bacterium]
MNIILVQPPDPVMPVVPLDSTYGDAVRFVPPWSLLCLRSYLLNKTKHRCDLVDCRLFSDIESNYLETLRAVPEPRLVVVNTPSLSLGQAVAVAEMTKANFPATPVVLCGQHPSKFPDRLGSIPHVDYAIAGDPEPVLKNLINFIDTDARLSRVQGLIKTGMFASGPSWLTDLRGLALPDWQGVFWPAYKAGPRQTGWRAKVRVSRGHTGQPADRAFRHAGEPLRIWPLDRIAACMQRCAHQGVVEVFVDDPPGVWTPDRLRAWCMALRDERNTQAWAFQTLPAAFSVETATLLYSAGCRRMEILFPSSDADILRRYGCDLHLHRIAAAVRALHSAGIQVKACFWLGGPEEGPGEVSRVVRILRRLGFCHFSLKAFPFAFDAPIYEDMPLNESKPQIDTWLSWARHPWTEERPIPLWGGKAAQAQISQSIEDIERAIARSPQRRLRRMINTIRSRNWILEMENMALGLFMPQDKPKGG